MRVYDHFPNPDCKGYTILNVHGYHGSPKNSAYTALHTLQKEAKFLMAMVAVIPFTLSGAIRYIRDMEQGILSTH